ELASPKASARLLAVLARAGAGPTPRCQQQSAHWPLEHVAQAPAPAETSWGGWPNWHSDFAATVWEAFCPAPTSGGGELCGCRSQSFRPSALRIWLGN